jgi:hypothetical protein
VGAARLGNGQESRDPAARYFGELACSGRGAVPFIRTIQARDMAG